LPTTAINDTDDSVYQLSCNDLNLHDVYVGHTTHDVKRKHEPCFVIIHIHAQTIIIIHVFINSLNIYKGGWDRCSIVLIETVICVNSLEAFKVERQRMESLHSTLN
jgi:hypothetical protein